ncbi:MAG: glutathione S-transferase N-terminal domain-containing protein [Proteobacteria bacterium]|nr:glutathione S-transferase N-terminal domain-containing protein [Pseudomonadota bacterium]
MIDFHFWPTPNGYKIALFLEETGLQHTVKTVDIGKGEQFEPAYLAISPSGKMPAIVDRAPADGGDPVSVFESGAILLYLAGKTGKCVPRDPRARMQCIEWLFWQMAGLGPLTGQYGHFHVHAPEKIPYAMQRYRNEAVRLLGVLDKRLQGRRFIAGEAYTIADMACYPWINAYPKAPLDLTPFPDLRRWHEAIAQRPATQRAYARGHAFERGGDMGEEERKILFRRAGM